MQVNDALDEAIRGRSQVVAESVVIGGRALELYRPRSSDDLIDEADFDVDERLPYWAEIWGSAQPLAERIAGEAGAGRTFLEIGCGVGLVALAAVRAGYDVTAIDYYAEALEFTRFNARHNGLPVPTTRLIDWRKLPDDLGEFDVVAASDVLYEKPNAPLVAAVFARTLAPNGLGLLTDPQRRVAAGFPEECRRQGLDIELKAQIPIVRGEIRQTINLYEITRRA